MTGDSTERQPHQASTPPLAPQADSPAVADKEVSQPHEVREWRNAVDDEGMDTKAKALTNLLKASSVCLQHFIHQL